MSVIGSVSVSECMDDWVSEWKLYIIDEHYDKNMFILYGI